jgi:hypothetical protein
MGHTLLTINPLLCLFNKMVTEFCPRPKIGTSDEGIQCQGDFALNILMAQAGIAQSVQRLAMGWTTEGSEFESR